MLVMLYLVSTNHTFHHTSPDSCLFAVAFRMWPRRGELDATWRTDCSREDGSMLKGNRLTVQFARGSRPREFLPVERHPHPRPHRFPNADFKSSGRDQLAGQQTTSFPFLWSLDLVFEMEPCTLIAVSLNLPLRPQTVLESWSSCSKSTPCIQLRWAINASDHILEESRFSSLPLAHTHATAIYKVNVLSWVYGYHIRITPLAHWYSPHGGLHYFWTGLGLTLDHRTSRTLPANQGLTWFTQRSRATGTDEGTFMNY